MTEEREHVHTWHEIGTYRELSIVECTDCFTTAITQRERPPMLACPVTAAYLCDAVRLPRK